MGLCQAAVYFAIPSINQNLSAALFNIFVVFQARAFRCFRLEISILTGGAPPGLTVTA